MVEPQECLSCSINPAVTTEGTVPLCTSCQKLVANRRGVQFVEPKQEKPEDQDDGKRHLNINDFKP